MKKWICFIVAVSILMITIVGCTNTNHNQPVQNDETLQGTQQEAVGTEVILTSIIAELQSGLSAVEFSGDDGFEAFLDAGGASSDREVVEYLTKHLLTDFNILDSLFGCSTISTMSSDGEHLFGRNFDWQNCDALVISSKPNEGYASISTVNMDFISQSGRIAGTALKLNDVRTLATLYAPLDGMNEKGLAVSVNMISDGETINQQTDKPDITTTTVIRLLLNRVAIVEEALQLLEQYDMHASMGMMVHFALADTTGRSVVVEYINNEMFATENPVVTNFYIAEWSIVFNLDSGEAHYYHRENYENKYIFKIK